MEKVSVFKYYSFGYNYGLLVNRLKSKNKENLINSLNKFLDFLNELNLRVTLRIASNLYVILEDIKNLEGDEVSDKIYAEIDKCLRKLDPALDSELQLKDLYVVTHRNYSIDQLMINIGGLFGKKVFVNLPNLSKYDFQEAGKCIALNLPTAAAFHLMRAIEGYIRYYYKEKIKRNRIENQLWGNLTNHLNAKKRLQLKFCNY